MSERKILNTIDELHELHEVNKAQSLSYKRAGDEKGFNYFAGYADALWTAGEIVKKHSIQKEEDNAKN